MGCSILHPYRGVDVKSEAFLEIIEYYGVLKSINFQGFDRSQVKFPRQYELKTIFPFVITLQGQIIPGEMDIFRAFSGVRGGISAVFQLSNHTLRLSVLNQLNHRTEINLVVKGADFGYFWVVNFLQKLDAVYSHLCELITDEVLMKQHGSFV